MSAKVSLYLSGSCQQQFHRILLPPRKPNHKIWKAETKRTRTFTGEMSYLTFLPAWKPNHNIPGMKTETKRAWTFTGEMSYLALEKDTRNKDAVKEKWSVNVFASGSEAAKVIVKWKRWSWNYWAFILNRDQSIPSCYPLKIWMKLKSTRLKP